METETMSDAIANELLKLQGTWKQTASEIDGVKNAVEEDLGSQPLVTFVGDTYVVTKSDGTVVIKGKFRLDPTQTPKSIDWTDTFGADASKTFPAIYTLEDNRLIFCAGDEDDPRPTELRAGPGQVLRVHERMA